MKQLFLFLSIAFICQDGVHAQLKADAGKDTVWCMGIWAVSSVKDSPALGGHPTAYGSASDPYHYLWSIQETTYKASNMLNSDTIPNPKLIDAPWYFVDSLHFILKVTDKNFVVAYDTVKVIFSRWITQTTRFYDKKDKDTIRLYANISASFKPLRYMWSPGIYLSDSTISSPKCWSPIPTIFYSVSVSDGLGCTDWVWDCYVDTKPTTVNNLETERTCSMFPNPAKNETILKLGDYWVGSKLFVLNSIGQIVLQQATCKAATTINCAELPAGIYYYLLENKQGEKIQGKFSVIR